MLCNAMQKNDKLMKRDDTGVGSLFMVIDRRHTKDDVTKNEGNRIALAGCPLGLTAAGLYKKN